MGRPGLVTRVGPCAAYRESIATFTRTDAWLTAGMTVAAWAETFWVGRWYEMDPTSTDRDLLVHGLADLAILLAVMALVLTVRRQRWRSVGFDATHLGRSLLAGGVPAAAMLGACWLVGAVRGHPATSPHLLTFSVPYYLVAIGFFEEVLWRGFITTRLAGAFRRRWAGVVLSGVLFGLMHLAEPLGFGGAAVGSILAENWWRVLVPFAWHFVLWGLYARYNSLAAPTLVHLAMNLSGELL